MRITDFKIPAAIQLVMDDIGWFWGGDGREIGEPSRTGMMRRHVLEDYIMINEIGRAINQKINAMLIIGEWDRNNVLRRIPHSNMHGDKWDSSRWLNIEEAEEIRDYLNSCEFIELGYHGLLHSAWSEDGEFLCPREFWVPEEFKKENPNALVSESVIREHFDAFLEIYDDWSFNQNLRTFANPGNPGNSWESDIFSRVLKDYGIKFWHNNSIRGCSVQSGIILNPKAIEICPWNVYDLDPLELPEYDPDRAGILGSHWPNFLRYNPKKSIERLADWKSFFDRQSEVFGMIISRDIEFAHYQQLYKAYAVVTEENDRIRIDLTKADEIAPEKNMPFYISFKNGNEPTECIGGKISLYESKGGFKNYKIERTHEKVIYIR